MNKNNENPLVSIITVCYNSEKYIRDTIVSVLNQTYDNIEYIIVDGDSTDNTLNIIKEYEPRFNGKMTWISESDKGIYDAMNKGINFSEGKYLYFLNSGDYFLQKNIIKKIISKSDSRDFIYGPVKVGEHIRENKVFSLFNLIFRTISHQGIIASQKCFINNKFNQDYNWLADYDWVIRCFKDSNISKKRLTHIFCYFDPDNNTGLNDKDLKLERLIERKSIGLKNFNGVNKFIFILNQLRLTIKFRLNYFINNNFLLF